MKYVAGLVNQASGSLVEVNFLELSSLHVLVLAFATSAYDWDDDGKGIGPEADTGNG